MQGKANDSVSSTSSPEAATRAGPSITKKTIDHLFAKLSALYGNKFADLWAGQDLVAVKATWRDAIADLTAEELRAGINALIVNGKAFPPTLPEFYAACRPPLSVPPVTDHRGLDRMAAKLGVSTANCYSYGTLRDKILDAVDKGQQEVPVEQRPEVQALPRRVAL